MKKILLFLFLILGVYSFSAPSYVDLNKIQRDGYQIDVNDVDTLAFSQEESDMNLVVTMYFKLIELIFKKVLEKIVME